MNRILFLSTLLLIPFSLFAQGWTPQSSGWIYQLSSVDFIDANVGWATGFRNFPLNSVVLHTTDGGETWTFQLSDYPLALVSVKFVDLNTGWVVGGAGTILHTTNGGESWSEQTSGTTWGLVSADFVDANTGWVVGDRENILHTTDGGATWTFQRDICCQSIVSVDFINAYEGFATGSNQILRTTDGGMTWVNTYNQGDDLYSVHLTDAFVGTAVGFDGSLYQAIIYRTTDGGLNWTLQPSPSDAMWFADVAFADPNRGWAVGHDGAIVSTTNGGIDWLEQESNVERLESVDFVDANTGWTVGWSGAILHTTTGGTGIQPPAAPTLNSPADGSIVSIDPLLRWNTEAGAQWYTLQVSRSAYFVSIVLNQTNIASTEYQFGNLEEGVYYWRVSMTDSTGTSGWSGPWSFTAASVPLQVTLVAPGDGALVTSDSAVLTWHETFPEVDRYWLEGDTDSLFATPFIDSLLTDTTYLFTPLPHNNTFWWKVKAHNSFGWGLFSEARSFLVYQEIPAAPVLLDPPNSATGISTNPTLSWNPSVGAESYALQVSDAPDFSYLVLDESQIDSTSYFTSDLQNATTYYWRVSATNDLGTSNWSDEWSFTTLLTGVETDNQLPAEFTLGQNFPNPFNPTTVIRYGLPERSYVKLELFDILGRQITGLIDEEQEAGYYNVKLEQSLLTSGIYFYRLEAHSVDGEVGSFVQTRKMVVLK